MCASLRLAGLGSAGLDTARLGGGGHSDFQAHGAAHLARGVQARHAQLVHVGGVSSVTETLLDDARGERVRLDVERGAGQRARVDASLDARDQVSAARLRHLGAVLGTERALGLLGLLGLLGFRQGGATGGEHVRVGSGRERELCVIDHGDILFRKRLERLNCCGNG